MTGFSGLADYATDVDSAIAQADRIASGPPPAVESQAPSERAYAGDVQGFGDSAFGRGLKKVGGWAFAIAILLIVKGLIWGGVHALSGSSDATANTANYAPAYSTESQGSEATDDSSAPSTASVDSASDSYAQGSTDEAQTDEASNEYSDQSLASDVTSRPAPGTSVLSRGELRYCMEEGLKLKGEQSEMETLRYTDVDRYNANVDTLNSQISDFRASCVNASYRASDEEAVDRDVSARSYALDQEGRNRVQ